MDYQSFDNKIKVIDRKDLLSNIFKNYSSKTYFLAEIEINHNVVFVGTKEQKKRILKEIEITKLIERERTSLEQNTVRIG